MSSDTEQQETAADSEGQVVTAEQAEPAADEQAEVATAGQADGGADGVALAQADDAGETGASTDESEQGDGAGAGQEGTGSGDSDKLGSILAMRVPVIVKLAQKTLTMSDVMKFHLGSVIGFDKDAYEQVELMVNNHTIGLGQTVKIGENFGLRIVEIRAVAETIKSLGEQPSED